MTCLFHYTNAEGLMGIVGSGELHASFYRFLNDPHEMEHGRSAVESLFRDAMFAAHTRGRFKVDLKKARRTLVDLSELTDLQDEESFLAYLGKHFARGVIVRRVLETLPFLISFSRHDDPHSEQHGLLNQWRDYGLNGGYAICFDRKSLVDRVASETMRGYLAADVDDVKYGEISWDDGSRKWAEDLSLALLDDRDSLLCVEGVEKISPAALKESSINLIRRLYHSLAFNKGRAFCDERESRLTVLIHPEPPEGSRLAMKKSIDYKPKGGAIVPFIKVFGEGKALPIKSVMVGPHPNQGRRAEALRFFLDGQNYGEVEVTCSEIDITNQF